jgi:non-specific serine/threonine protein kinase
MPKGGIILAPAMPILTSQLIDNFPYSRYADSRSIQRGRDYFKEGRAWDVNLVTESRAVCLVDGDSGEYTVQIAVDKKSGSLTFDCDCPYAEEGNFCKHMIAAALAVSEYLKDDEADEDYEDEDDDEEVVTIRPTPQANFNRPPSQPSSPKKWRQQLENALLQIPRTTSVGAHVQKYAAVILLSKETYYYQGGHSLKPYIVRARDWSILQALVQSENPDINDLLDKNREWIKYSEEMRDNANPAGCLNLSNEALNLLNFLQQVTRFYYSGISSMVNYLPMLAQLNVPVFLTSSDKRKIHDRVQIIAEPSELEIAFTHEHGTYNLQAALQNKNFAPGKAKAEMVSYNPPWLLMDNLLFPLRNSSHIALLSSFPISIPESEAEFFRETYLRRVAELLPIKSDLVKWNDVQTTPVPRLYLHDNNKDKTLRADLRFGYGEHEVTASKAGETQSIETVPNSWELVRIQRQPEREGHFYQLLTDPSFRLKRASSTFPFGTLELRARAHPFDFLLHSIPLLTQAGFEIYGEDNLKLGKINRATPSLHVSITSGIDWFDLKTLVEFGDQQISFHDVRKALKRGEHYVKLADGSVGQIPDEWLEKYKHLWNLAEETADGFRVADVHLSLLDSLLEDDASIQTPAELRERRERFRTFERIEPRALPSGFVGELRPYQKHGFDWLYFLRDYNFGGILADDMGLGKTVQVLAYLQSLQEQARAESEARAASLLVVPKSLIANWQRESEKFTPSLRFLEYMGNFRNKDAAIFNDYDVVLTTYGTMLRDVELLREYKFNYVVLDESQAIKNPLAKSAKAARLLNAEHRLVMTGTPVENNTFELWSQFAFLNPGLLGNMDYFKSAFATPIEAKGDEETAKTLRKLVYPFILRRTKEQVAPELPPRTERIVYTDMDAAQKKLYAQTREKYRAELLGLIETEGMNDVRFKILEGLLRLRQIAIHPALVEKNYRGEAPKFEVLLETLETLQAEGHKALVFSQFVETLKLLKCELDERKVKYVYLDGKTQNRQEHVDQFQDDPKIPFFLISLKAGGVGLNLTAADYVIHLDPWWNPAVEMQASDRAHRIGQDKPVFVYKIIARDTVEEKILQLQEKKRALVKNIIATEASFFKSLTQDDVKDLFS